MTTNGTPTGGTIDDRSPTRTTPAKRRSRFASGAAVRLPLSDGDWVLVHEELSYGQQRRLANAGLSGVPAALAADGMGERLSVDWAAFELEKLATWVMDWSFRDDDGAAVYVSREAIEALHPDTAAEITAALDAHIEAQQAKKAPAVDGPSKPGATSSSASASAGAGTR
jgi:hypothetical protein